MRRNKVRGLLCLMLMGLVVAQPNSPNTKGENRHPLVKRDFSLTESDLYLFNIEPGTKVEAVFLVNKDGKVIDPHVKDSANARLDKVIINKLKEMEFYPALQNGMAVTVRYTLPILFQ